MRAKALRREGIDRTRPAALQVAACLEEALDLQVALVLGNRAVMAGFVEAVKEGEILLREAVVLPHLRPDQRQRPDLSLPADASASVCKDSRELSTG